jgi:hypothetical protein
LKNHTQESSQNTISDDEVNIEEEESQIPSPETLDYEIEIGAADTSTSEYLEEIPIDDSSEISQEVLDQNFYE